MEPVSEGGGGRVPVYHPANSLKILLINRPHCIYGSVSNGLKGLSWEICHGDYLCWYGDILKGFLGVNHCIFSNLFLSYLFVVLGYYLFYPFQPSLNSDDKYQIFRIFAH